MSIEYRDLKIVKEGLKLSETAIFTLSSSDPAFSPYSISLTGINETSPVSVIVKNLPLTSSVDDQKSKYTVSESNWSWTYSTESSSKWTYLDDDASKVATVTFINTKQAVDQLNSEDSKTNVFGDSPTPQSTIPSVKGSGNESLGSESNSRIF